MLCTGRAGRDEDLVDDSLVRYVDPGARPRSGLARFSHQLTVEARHRPAITSLRLLAVLNVLFEYARIVQETGRRAARALY